MDKFAKKIWVILLLLTFSGTLISTSAKRRKRLLSTGCQSSYCNLSFVLSVTSPTWGWAGCLPEWSPPYPGTSLSIPVTDIKLFQTLLQHIRLRGKAGHDLCLPLLLEVLGATSLKLFWSELTHRYQLWADAIWLVGNPPSVFFISSSK